MRKELKHRGLVTDSAALELLSVHEVVTLLDQALLVDIRDVEAQEQHKLLQSQKESAQEAKRSRRAVESEARQKRADEAKRRAEAKKRRAELQKLREEKERQDEMQRIERELACMAEEDVFGEQMRDDLRALERWEAEAERALKMVGELGEFRNEDAQDLLREEEAGTLTHPNTP